MSRLCALALCAALAAGCASLGLHGGDSERSLTVGGRARSYLLHVPRVTPAGGLPLVVVLHGAGGNAQAIARRSGFSEEADRRGFAVAYANGSAGSGRWFAREQHLVWNAGACCAFAHEQGIDDVAFVRALVDDVASHWPIDRKRVFAAGHSNGGMMTYRLACEASDVFAAVGVVAGALVSPGCAPREPVSLLHIHGTDDRIVPLTGGVGAIRPRGFAYPATESGIAFWVEADGCDPTPSTDSPATGVSRRRYAGCRARSEVELLLIAGGGHGWPDDATSVLWEFLASHSKP